MTGDQLTCSSTMPALQLSKRSGLCCAHSIGLSAIANADLARWGESVGSTNCRQTSRASSNKHVSGMLPTWSARSLCTILTQKRRAFSVARLHSIMRCHTPPDPNQCLCAKLQGYSRHAADMHTGICKSNTCYVALSSQPPPLTCSGGQYMGSRMDSSGL